MIRSALCAVLLCACGGSASVNDVVTDHVLLRFQDQDARFFADLEVSKAEQEQWLSILDAT
jgi:hypothetical protein